MARQVAGTVLLVLTTYIGGLLAVENKCEQFENDVGLPIGLEQVMQNRQYARTEVGKYCQGDEIYMQYEHLNGVPLYSATVIGKGRFEGDHKRQGKWRDAAQVPLNKRVGRAWSGAGNDDIRLVYQHEDEDVVAHAQWMDAALGSRSAGIDRGHLIPSLYAENTASTFVYQNCIPQFAANNKGAWRVCEERFFTWVTGTFKGFTDKDKDANVLVYVMVGTVPSFVVNGKGVYFGPGVPLSAEVQDAEQNPNAGLFQNVVQWVRGASSWVVGQVARWWSVGGEQNQNQNSDAEKTVRFSSIRDPTNFPLNVPSAMWTAACLVVRDSDNNIVKVVNSAFVSQNAPRSGDACLQTTVGGLFTGLPQVRTKPELFPNIPKCSDSANNHRW